MDITSLITELDAIDLRLTRMASIGGGLLSHTTQGKKASSALRTAILSLDTATPVPPTVITSLKGSSALTGSLTATAGQSVLNRWGPQAGAAARLFAQPGSGWVPAPVLPSQRLLLSWKPDLDVPLDAAACLAAMRTAPPKTKVTSWHEADVKIIKGDDPAPMLTAQRDFAALIRAERPDLDVTVVLAGYRFHPDENPADIEHYADPATFDVLGVDLDGIKTKYADFRTFVPGIMAYLAKHGKTRWTVPEFGAPRLSTDPDGTQRAAWITEQVAFLRALPNPPEEICLFESRATSYVGTELTSTVEQDAWRNA